MTVIRALALSVAILLTFPSFAQTTADGDVQKFQNEYKDFSKRMVEVNEKIRQTIDKIKQNNNKQSVQEEVGKLQGAVADLLTSAADNGGISEIGHSALDNAREKYKEMQKDTHFTPAQKLSLLKDWKKILDATESSVNNLNENRQQLAEVLRALQTNQDYITAKIELERAQSNVDAINDLTAELQRLSDQIRQTLSSKEIG